MRVLMLQDHWWPEVGGGPNHVRELSKAIEAAGHDVEIYTRALVEDGKRYHEPEVIGENIHITRCGPVTEFHNLYGRLVTLLTMAPITRLGEFDVIHAHTFLPAATGKIYSSISGIPVVLTIHGTAIPSGVGLSDSGVVNWVERQIERFLLLSVNYDSIISVNREHLSLLSPHQDNLTYIPNGVDTSAFETRPESDGYILYLGRLALEKRVSDLIKAFDEIADEFPDIDLVLAGSGPEEENLMTLVEERGLAKRVEFKGRVPDEKVSQLYSRSNAFVLPSVWEGHPLTLLEAWASRVPVITTDVEGVREFTDHMATSYVVEPESPSKIAEGIRFILNNPKEADKMAQEGYELVATEYTWEDTAKKTIEVYHSVVQ